MSAFLITLTLLTVMGTSIFSGIFGMAGGILLMGILITILPVQQALVLHATSQFFANISRAFIHREHIHIKSVKYYLAGLCLSFLLFAPILFLPSKTLIFILLGISPFVQVFLKGKLKLNFRTPKHAFFCGAIVTCFQLTSGVSGPIMDLFFQKTRMPRHQVIATKAITQAASHIIKFVYFAFIIKTTSTTIDIPLWVYFSVIPITILGSNVGKIALTKITDEQFYKFTAKLLFFIGVIYLIRAAVLIQTGA